MVGGFALSLLPQAAAWCWLQRLRIGGAAERIGLAIGFGLAVPSAAYFVARWLGMTPFWYVLTECALAGIALTASLVYQRASPAATPVPDREQSSSPPRPVAITIVLAIAVLSGLVAAYHLASHPEGTWDAWAIWNVRAAFLAQPTETWRLGFDSALAHPDYPVLLPGAVARTWAFAGSQATWIPALVAVAFIVATALVVTGSLWTTYGPVMGIAGLALLMTPEFLFQGTAQIADVPLAFFAVTAVTVVAARPPLRSSSFVLAGFACGCAAWTKNEGLVLAASWPMLVAASTGWRLGRSAATSAIADFVIGAGPILVLLAVFKLVLAPPNDVVSGLMAPGALGYWADSTRVSFVVREMALGLFSWGGWPWPSAAVLLGIVGLVLAKRTAWPPVGALLLMQFLAFFVIYVMTPQSVAWHIQTSWPRLIAQMWPTMVWWGFARDFRMRPSRRHRE